MLLSSDYFIGLLSFPLLILAICVALTLGLGLSLCCFCMCRTCCKCVKCVQKKVLDPKDENYLELLAKQVNYHVRIVRTFLFFSTCLFIVNFFVWYGNSEITSAFKSMVSGLNNMKSFFTSIINLTTALIQNAGDFISAVSVDCIGSSSTSTFVNVVNSISSVTNSIESLADKIVTVIQNIVDQIPGYISRKDIVIGCFFGIIFLLFLLFMISLYFSSRCLFRFSIFLSWFTVLALFVVSSLEMFIVVSYALYLIP